MTNRTHGMYRTPTYASWECMMNRCYRSKTTGFHNYGGRGVSVCEKWHRFENFFADMGERPNGAHIDRVDPDGNYEPNNCRWLDGKLMHWNRRDTRMLEYGDVSKPLRVWAREMGVDPGCLRYRIAQGWSIKRAIETPSRRARS